MRIRKINFCLNASVILEEAVFDKSFLIEGNIIREKEDGLMIFTDTCTKGIPEDSKLEDVKIFKKNGILYASFFMSHESFDEGINDFECEYVCKHKEIEKK